jgi:hypothetical protein
MGFKIVYAVTSSYHRTDQVMGSLLAKMAVMKAQVGSLVSWMDSHYEEMEVKLDPNEGEIKTNKEEIIADMKVWHLAGTTET